MAGDAIFGLKNLLAGAGFVADGAAVGSCRAAGVNRGCIKDEGDAKRAQDSSLVDAAVPPKNGKGLTTRANSVAKSRQDKVSYVH